MATLRELKARIGSVASSEKITGAMKMISSAKMHKAEQALRQLKPFRSQIETIIANLLSSDVDFASPLMESREVKAIALVAMGSDDGLCGAYNVNVGKKVVVKIAELKERYPGATITIMPIGNKMTRIVSKLKDERVDVGSVDGVDSKSDRDAIGMFTDRLRTDFLARHFDLVCTVSTLYHSVSRQSIESRQLLPVESASLSATDGNRAVIKPYIFEPSPAAIVNSVLPLFLLAVTQDLFTQNQASEQAARVMAMQSANDNARKLLEQLRLEYNKQRQQSITSELLDIVGGQVR